MHSRLDSRVTVQMQSDRRDARCVTEWHARLVLGGAEPLAADNPRCLLLLLQPTGTPADLSLAKLISFVWLSASSAHVDSMGLVYMYVLLSACSLNSL